jgi:hypothetical protein
LHILGLYHYQHPWILVLCRILQFAPSTTLARALAWVLFSGGLLCWT